MLTTIPETNGVEIKEVGGVKYLIARLDERGKTCSDYLEELRKGKPVVVTYSKRGHLTGLLKKESVFTRQKTVVAGQWVAFFPCSARNFK